MQRYYYYWLALAMMPMQVSAQSYFKEGTIWKSEWVSGDGKLVKETDYLKGPEMVDGYETYKMYSYYDNKKQTTTFYGYVRTDADKVYFMPANTELGQWFLVYDFGLKVGEGCYVHNFESTQYKTYIKCVGMTETPYPYSHLTSLIIEEYEDDSCEKFYNKAYWIKGVSSDWGLKQNSLLLPMGMLSDLIEVSYYGNVIYKKDYTPICNIKDEASKITISGKVLTITNVENINKIGIYTSAGVLVGWYNVDYDNTNITLPSEGVYIVKMGDVTQKIVVQ